MRKISVFGYGISRLIGYLPLRAKGKKLLKEGKIEEFNEKIMGKIKHATTVVLKKAGTTLDVKGLENVPKNEPVAFVCNHQGNFDPVVLMSTLEPMRLGFIAKIEIKKIKFLATWMELIGCTFIDRKNPRNAIKGIEAATENVKNGTSMAFFPEGTRSKSSNVGEFKTGVFKVIEKAKVKVVPVAINGTYNIMEANDGKIKPANVTVTYCKPIETKDYTKEDYKLLPEKVKSIIIENMR